MARHYHLTVGLDGVKNYRCGFGCLFQDVDGGHSPFPELAEPWIENKAVGFSVEKEYEEADKRIRKCGII